MKNKLDDTLADILNHMRASGMIQETDLESLNTGHEVPRNLTGKLSEHSFTCILDMIQSMRDNVKGQRNGNVYLEHDEHKGTFIERLFNVHGIDMSAPRAWMYIPRILGLTLDDSSTEYSACWHANEFLELLYNGFFQDEDEDEDDDDDDVLTAESEEDDD
jgi:hypothetical protein